MKKCTRCEITKALSEYSYRNKSKNLLQAQCKTCVAIRDKVSYDNPNRKISIRKAAKIFQNKCRDFANDYKEKRGCVKCGEKRYYVLEFHHLGDKENNISNLVSSGVSIENLLKEIEKCIVVCSNCHKEIHHFERTGQVS